MKRLELSKEDRMFLGVCGGFGKLTDRDPTIYRIIFIFMTLLFPFLIFLYFLFALVMAPKK